MNFSLQKINFQLPKKLPAAMWISINSNGNPSLRERLYYYIIKAAYYLIAVVLIFSGISKIIEPLGFLEILTSAFPEGMDSHPINENIILIFATILPLIEVTIGVLLLIKVKDSIALLAAAILFAAFILFAIYGFAFGIVGDCGCFGKVVESGFGWGMILRNSIFFLLSIFILGRQKVLNEII